MEPLLATPPKTSTHGIMPRDTLPALHACHFSDTPLVFLVVSIRRRHLEYVSVQRI